MRRKNDLFELISAMSRSEKRYFTIDAQKGERKDSRYLALFRAINDQEEYDEKMLRKEFGRSLSDDKARLYEAILRSMRDYRSSKSHLARIKELILDAKFLYERGLYQQSQERLRSAKVLAQELGDRLTLLEVNKEERRLWKYLRPGGYETELDKLMQEMQVYAKELDAELQYLDHHDRLLVESYRHPKLTESQKAEIRQRYAFLLNGTSSAPESVQGQLRYYQCFVFLYQMLGQPDQVYNYCQKVVDCWNRHPHYKSEDFYNYILHASNLLYAAFTTPDKFHHLPVLLQSLESEHPSSVHDQQVLYQKVTNYRLVYHINSGDFTDLDNRIAAIDEGLQKYRLTLDYRLMISANCAVLYFAATRYADCVSRCESIMGNKRSAKARRDVWEGIRLLRLMAVYELEDPVLLEASLRATTRFFKQNESAFAPFIQFNLKLFRKLLHADPLSLKSVFKDAQQQLMHDPSLKKTPMGLNELMSFWCASKNNPYSVADYCKGEAKLVSDPKE